MNHKLKPAEIKNRFHKNVLDKSVSQVKTSLFFPLLHFDLNLKLAEIKRDSTRNKNALRVTYSINTLGAVFCSSPLLLSRA